ncbi:MAG: zinc ribbon domain-containing protein [Dehalococcoidia bacterium]|nr:MAG: zinc ribbon domain-containing protein [Dehalococcoidia bacterium]
MPIYQYDCGDCGRAVEILFRSAAKAADPRCPECGSARLQRRISKVARVRRSGERLDGINVAEELGHLESKDERGFAKWAKQMGEKFDTELGSNFRELAQKADAGLNPVERADVKFTLENSIRRAKEAQASDSTGD